MTTQRFEQTIRPPYELFEQPSLKWRETLRESRSTISGAVRGFAVRRVAIPDRTREMNWLRENGRIYEGEWVALDGGRLIAHGPKAKAVLEKARSLGIRIPLIVRVPLGDQVHFAGW